MQDHTEAVTAHGVKSRGYATASGLHAEGGEGGDHRPDDGEDDAEGGDTQPVARLPVLLAGECGGGVHVALGDLVT